MAWSNAVGCNHYPWEGGISGHHSEGVDSILNCLHPDGLTRPTADSGSHGVSSSFITDIARQRPTLDGSSLWVHQPSNYIYAVDKVNFHTDTTYLHSITVYRGAYNINYILIACSILLNNFQIVNNSILTLKALVGSIWNPSYTFSILIHHWL